MIPNRDNQNLITEQLKKIDKKEFASYLSKDFIDSISKMKIEDFRELYLINPEILDDTVLDFFYKNINKVDDKSCDNCKFKYSEKCPVTGLNNIYSRFSCNVWRLK